MGGAAVLAAVSLLLGAEPYVRTKVDASDAASHCLLWETPELVFRQNAAGNDETTGDSELLAFAESLTTWNSAGAQCSSMVLRDGTRTSSTQIGWIEDSAANENLVVYRKVDCDAVVPAGDSCLKDVTCQNKYNCWDQANATIAVTTTTYHPEVGRIYDTDIEGNAAHFIFTTVDSPPCVPPVWEQSCVATDVRNTMTHEIGHALGLDHAPQTWSTMFAKADSGETEKRQIDSGSREFLCEAYPKGGIPLDCVTARAQSELGDSASCAAAPGALALAALLLAPALARRRHRRL